MLRKFMLSAAVIVAGAAAPALAVTPTITFTSGVYALPSYTTATVFNSFEADPLGTYSARAHESTTGDVVVAKNTIPGFTVDTDGNKNNQYLSIEGGGSYTVNFTTPVEFFSFVLGSLDNYNSLLLTFADGTKDLLTGTQIIGASGIGPFNSSTSGRVNFDLGGQSGITSATFASTQNAFEIDALAAAVPEPATWAMMMVGIGAVGAGLRRRPKTAATFSFA